MNSLAQKLNRAAALGWSPAMPRYMGPCRWIRTKRSERRAFLSEMRRFRLLGRIVLGRGEDGT